jgi:hypothetical protein
MAVGGLQSELWDESGWSVNSITAPPSSADQSITGVSCVGSPIAYCALVGYYQIASGAPNQGFIESWNGDSWSLVPNPNPGFGDELSGVSCTSSTNCVAVGVSYPSDNPGGITLVESWDGTTWSVVSSPNGGEPDSLSSVSCTSPTSCLAIGEDYTGSWQALVESWNGSIWSIAPNPNITGYVSFGISDISCTGSPITNCLAVGDGSSAKGVWDTLVESWDGSTWLNVSSPNVGKDGNFLNGVSCFSPSDCVAAGFYDKYGRSNTLIQSWNGSAMAAVPSPNPGSTSSPYSNIFDAVSCVSSTICMAVGQSAADGDSELFGLIETTIPLTISTTSLPVGTIGSPYSTTLTAVGGDPPYRWDLAKGSGPLPSGLKLNKTTGVISGTPKPKSVTSTFTVEVLDTKTAFKPAIQHTAESTFTITIESG